MEQISNKTLTYLLIAAIVVSIGGTMISIYRINMLVPRVTGMASTATGKVNVSIAAVSSISTSVDNLIDFGACSPNSTTGSNISSNLTGSWGTLGVCQLAGGLADTTDNITVQNDGNKDVNVTVQTDTAAGSSFIGGTDPGFYYSVRNGSNRPGCFNRTVATASDFDGPTGMQWAWKSFAAATTDYLACANLTYGDSNDQMSMFALLDLPPDAPATAVEQSVTVTFTAASLS